MFWKRSALRPLTLFAAAVLLARPAGAQLGAQSLPDLSGLADAIEQSVQNPAAKPAPGTLYRSGLAVPSVHPGQTAQDIGRQLREATERQTGPNPALRKLEAQMPTVLTSTEMQIEKQGLAKRDLGVALGVFFVGNWETANTQELSNAAEANAIRTVSAAAAKKYQARYAALAPAAQEKTYESLLVSSLLMNIFAKTFDKAGKTQDAAGIRQTAGAMFQKVVGVPPTQVKIAPDGRITGTGGASPGAAPASAQTAAPPSRGAAPVAAGRLVRGGPIKPGLYVGDQVCHGLDGHDVWRNHFRLSLYADGEYRMCDENDKEVKEFPTGHYRYDPRTGRLDIHHNLNLYNDGDDSVCLFGRDAGGRPQIVSAVSFLRADALLRYAGPTPHPAPEAEAKAKADAVDNGRREIAATGRGVQPSQIAGVFAEQHTVIGAGGFPGVAFEPVLALRDGTYCTDFDVPPAEFDAAAHRRLHPERWHRWRSAGPKKYQVQDSHGRWEGAVWIGPLPPSPPGTTLNGGYSHIGGGGSVASGVVVAGIHEFHFTPDGHFTLGSSVSGSGPGFAVGSNRGPQGGTYTINGYALTLKYADGHAERHAFVFLDASNKHDFYLDGSQFMRLNGK